VVDRSLVFQEFLNVYETLQSGAIWGIQKKFNTLLAVLGHLKSGGKEVLGRSLLATVWNDWSHQLCVEWYVFFKIIDWFVFYISSLLSVWLCRWLYLTLPYLHEWIISWLLTGVSIIGVHPTSEINSTVDGRTKGDEPRSNVSVHPACRHCHFTVVAVHSSIHCVRCIQ